MTRLKPLPFPALLLLSCLTSCLMSCAHSAAAGSAPESARAAAQAEPPRGLNLRGRLAGFSLEQKRKMWELEDQLIAAERLFTDDLRKRLRDSERQQTESLASSDDWKRAKRDAADALRKQQQDLRQQVRIRREEMELQLLRFLKEREEELQKFASGLEAELKEYEKEPGYRAASSDLSEGKTELRDALSRFRDRAKNLKPRENFWE